MRKLGFTPGGKAGSGAAGKVETYGCGRLPGAPLIPLHKPNSEALCRGSPAAGRRRGILIVGAFWTNCVAQILKVFFHLQDLLMYLLQLVQALKYENFGDIQGGLEPGSKRDSQGLSDDSPLDRSAWPWCWILAEKVTLLNIFHSQNLNLLSALERNCRLPGFSYFSLPQAW